MNNSFLHAIFAAGVLCFGINASAQDVQSAAAAAAQELSKAAEVANEEAKPTFWTSSAKIDLGLNQTSLWDWAAGGYNTFTLNTGLDANANYAKDLMSWGNRLQLQYGFLWSADKDNLLQKSTDRIYLESKWAYKTSPTSKWNYTASLDFRSQFTDSYDDYKLIEGSDEWTGTLKSGFLSPAYTNLALGMEWKPADWFNINLAPVTGGVVITTNELLRANYGMPKIEGSESYRPVLFQFGAQIKANANVSINDKFFFETQVVVFTDYLNKPFVYNRVNWDNKITWQAAKFFKIGLSTWLIYDPIVVIDDVMSKVQFKEFLSLSFTYTIASKER